MTRSRSDEHLCIQGLASVCIWVSHLDILVERACGSSSFSRNELLEQLPLTPHRSNYLLHQFLIQFSELRQFDKLMDQALIVSASVLLALDLQTRKQHELEMWDQDSSELFPLADSISLSTAHTAVLNRVKYSNSSE